MPVLFSESERRADQQLARELVLLQRIDRLEAQLRTVDARIEVRVNAAREELAREFKDLVEAAREAVKTLTERAAG
jgi:hypothetical protein